MGSLAWPFFLLFSEAASPPSPPFSLHDALPIYESIEGHHRRYAESLHVPDVAPQVGGAAPHRLHVWLAETVLLHSAVHLERPDRKSTRLNSSHVAISYAVFCLKKKQMN